LRAPQRGGGEVLVDPGLKTDVVLIELTARADELLIESAERRAAIAGDIAGGIEPGSAVALLLHQAQPHQRLEAGHEYAAFAEVVFVVEGDAIERHCAGLRPLRSGATAGTDRFDSRDIGEAVVGAMPVTQADTPFSWLRRSAHNIP